MIYANLPETIRGLESGGQLPRVASSNSAKYEITCFLDRLAKSGGHAVLFENVQGQTMPVLGNLFGTASRTEHLLGVGKVDDLSLRGEDLL